MRYGNTEVSGAGNAEKGFRFRWRVVGAVIADDEDVAVVPSARLKITDSRGPRCIALWYAIYRLSHPVVIPHRPCLCRGHCRLRMMRNNLDPLAPCPQVSAANPTSESTTLTKSHSLIAAATSISTIALAAVSWSDLASWARSSGKRFRNIHLPVETIIWNVVEVICKS